MADYRVADISLSDFGNREIRLAESEMPALIALRGVKDPAVRETR